MMPIAKSANDLENHLLASEAGFADIAPFLLGVSDFVARKLPSEDAIERKGVSKGRTKLISDHVVGYVRFESWESALLDTPLFQRLRAITQLSFVKHVYPTLGYCRFEHTIGMLGRTSQIVKALLENARFDPGGELMNISKIIEQQEPTLRLAALFHDVGHCIYSHASETYIATLAGTKGYPSAQAIREFFARAFKRDNPPPIAEIIAVAILLSPEIEHFITEVLTEKKAEVVTRIRDAAYFVFGSPPPTNGLLLFLAQIISSGLDADKLDYMARESYYSRIPIGIDIPWLLSKLRVFRCSVKTLPKAYTSLKHSFAADSEFLALGLVASGQLEFEEFCFARVSLYDKIYLHHKNRALTAQAQSEFRRFTSRTEKFRCVHSWLDLKEADVAEETGSKASTETLFAEMNPQVALTVGERDRHFHRAFAFGPRNSLTDPFGGGDALDTLPSVMLLNKIKGQEAEWARKIQVETRKIIGLAKAKAEKFEDHELTVAVDTAGHVNIQQGHDSLYFQRPRRPASRWILPVDMIVDYYRRNRACGYVFAPAKLCAYVALAAEVVFWRDEKQQFSQDDGVPHHVLSKASEVKEKLVKKGYYDDLRVLRPASKYLSSAAASELMHTIAEHLAGFQSFKLERVTPQRVASFVAQFPEELHEVTLKMCAEIKVLEPAKIADLVVAEYLSLINGAWKGKKVALVPLGSIIESGALLSYNFKNHSNPEFLKSSPRVETLSDNVVNEVDAIIFYDDNINSGSQLLNNFATRLDVELPADRKHKEVQGSKLSDVARERLKTLPMHFVFGIAPEGALVRIQEDFDAFFKISRTLVTLKALHILKASEKTLSGPASTFRDDKRGELKLYLEKIGTGLMLNEEDKTEAIARARALGDENAEALIVFPYNVPTMTLLPLWCEGKVKGGDFDATEWMPLVERRRSRSSDGAFVGDDA